MDIYSLLNINEDVLKNFPLLANRVADHQVEKVINHNTSKLKKIEDNANVDKNINVSPQSIDEIIKKVIIAASNKDYSNDQWSLRELRIVSYYLMKLRGNANAYYFALTLLDQNWRNLFFNGLMFYLLNSWHNIEPEYRERTCGLLVKKLMNYDENNKRYLFLKQHVNFFEPSGPQRLAALVLQKRMNVLDAPSLLGKRTSALSASYFSDVIIKYYKDKRIENFSALDNIFCVHNLDRTRKLVFANLVAYENGHPDGFRRAKLCQYINRTLGDVTLAATWAPFLGATYEEAQTLKVAMKMVNIWFAQQIIETFFEICVQDKTRKEFWLDYVEYIDSFKIVGSNVIKSLLHSNEKIGSTFAKHFIETNSTTSQTSALVLFMKNKVLVEFSDTGALYVYHQNHPKANLLRKRYPSVTTTADLKQPSMDKLIDIYEWSQGNNQEGKMSHIGYWQSRLSKWMKEMVINSNSASFNFSKKEDDAIFKAQPLPKEETFTTSTSYKYTKEEKNYWSETNFKNKSKSTEETDRKIVELKGNNVSQFLTESTVNNDDNLPPKTPARLNDIKFNIASKYINDEYKNIRIVADYNNFYLYHKFKREAIFLHINNYGGLGNIWIKKTDDPLWFEIVHYFMGKENSIGFFRNIFNGVIFKEDLHSLEERHLTFV